MKRAAALANEALGVLEPDVARAIADAAAEVASGALDAHFPLDVFQTGSGTSTNTNANEVIAARARARLAAGATPKAVHPNDHVNASQSSNDVIPTALHLAALLALRDDLAPALAALEARLRERAHDVRRRGEARPHALHGRDAGAARPGVRGLGAPGRARPRAARARGATRSPSSRSAARPSARGSNCPPGFAARAIAELERATGLRLSEAQDHFEAQSARDACVEASGALRVVALSLAKIASDVRLLGSGPRGALGELALPAIQPGSSIMPGKVNPVICEVVLQVAAQVIGNDAAIGAACLTGQLELLTAIPVIARNLLESIRLLASAARVFEEKCLRGIEARSERAEALVEDSLAMVTALAPAIGYDAAAELAKEAWRTGRRVRELALEKRVLPPDELARLLDPRRQTGR